MTLSTPFPAQKSDITFGYDAMYETLRMIGGTRSGVLAVDDFKVSQRAAGANMSVDVAIGYAWVAITSAAYGGPRMVRNNAAMNSGTPGSPATGWLSTFSAADGTNPRVDRVVLTVRDNLVDSSGNYDARLRVVGGTPTAGATNANLNGAAAVPVNSLLLANVLVAAGASSIADASIDTLGDGWGGGTSVRPRAFPDRSCSAVVTRTSTAALTANTPADVTFENEVLDTDNCWTAGDPTRLYARTPGIYLCRARAEFAYNASAGWRGATIADEAGTTQQTATLAVATASQATGLPVTYGPVMLAAASNRRWIKLTVVSNISLNLTYAELAFQCVAPLAV